MIKAGIKKEEYREIKPHYIRQFIKFEPLKNDLIRDYNFHIDFDEGEINGMESELLSLKYDVLEFSLAYPSRAEKDKWLTFKNPRIRIGTGRPEWGAEPGKNYFVITWEE
jgi:hypothetical protein